MHRDAVVKFVKSTIDLEERKARLEAFKKLYGTIKLCRTLQCIESWIYANQEIPRFSQRYALDHEYAEQTTQILREKDRRELLMCGFRDAIKSLENNLESGLNLQDEIAPPLDSPSESE